MEHGVRMKTEVRDVWWKSIFWALALISLSACATPDARIRRNQAAFAALSAADQALIKEGKVAIGFTPEMVKLAVGAPDQRWMRKDAAGSVEVWSYTTYDGKDGVPLFRGEYHHYAGGYPYFYDNFYARGARAREYFKVTFSEGKVSAVEQSGR